jgi:hypothetical protein
MLSTVSTETVSFTTSIDGCLSTLHSSIIDHESTLILGTRLIDLTELSVIEHRALEKVNGGRLALTVCRTVNHNATELFESQA